MAGAKKKILVLFLANIGKPLSKKQLAKEQEFTAWSVALQRKSRAGRIEELKKKGLL